MEKSPCADCPKKGCGAYHDICPDYQPWAKNMKDSKNSIKDTYTTKPHMERSKSFRRSKNNIVLQDHRK